MTEDEQRIVGDDGELLKPDTTSTYYEVTPSVTPEPVATVSTPRHRPMNIVVGIVVVAVITVLSSLCGEINSRFSGSPTYDSFDTLEEINRLAPIIATQNAIRAATSQPTYVRPTYVRPSATPVYSVEQRRANVTWTAIVRGLYLTQTQDARVSPTPRSTNTPHVISTEAENVSATLSPTP